MIFVLASLDENDHGKGEGQLSLLSFQGWRVKSSQGVLGRQYTLSYMFSLCCGIVGEAELAAPNVEVEALAAPGLESGLVFLEVEALDVPDLAVKLAALDVGVEALAVSGLDAGVALLAVGVLVVAELEADLAEPGVEVEALAAS